MKKIIIIFFNYYYFINNYFSDLYIHILMYIYNQNIHVLCDQGGCTFVQDPVDPHISNWHAHDLWGNCLWRQRQFCLLQDSQNGAIAGIILVYFLNNSLKRSQLFTK